MLDRQLANITSSPVYAQLHRLRILYHRLAHMMALKLLYPSCRDVAGGAWRGEAIIFLILPFMSLHEQGPQERNQGAQGAG